jgi:hypothetical protein
MQFIKGQSGNLKGRPKNTKKKLEEVILNDRFRAYKFVQKAMKEGEPWAYEVYFSSLLPDARATGFIQPLRRPRPQNRIQPI